MLPPSLSWKFAASPAASLAAVLCLQALRPALCARRAATGSAAGDSGQALGLREFGAASSGCVNLDPTEAEAELRAESPQILGSDERIQLATGDERGSRSHFTDTRIVISSPWPAHGGTTFQTIPYGSVEGFAVRITGDWPKMTSHADLYTNIPSLPKVTAGFQETNATCLVNIYDVSRLLSKRVLGVEVPKLVGVESFLQTSSGASTQEQELCAGGRGWFSQMLRDTSRVDTVACERDVQRNTALLGGSERVLMAFNEEHTTLILTSRRVIRHYAENHGMFGMFGRGKAYESIPYEAIEAVVLQTDATAILFSKVRILTRMPGFRSLELTLMLKKEDIQGLQSLLSDKILGTKSTAELPADSGHPKDIGAWIFESSRGTTDPQEAEKVVRSHGMLQAEGDETVLLAFGVWPSHMNLLTSKRLLMMETVKAGAVQYTTIPYHAVRAFSIETGGASPSLKIWTGTRPGEKDEDMSSVSLAFRMAHGNMHEDLVQHKAQQILSASVLGFGCCPPDAGDTPSQADRLKDFYAYLADRTKEVDLERVEQEFKQALILHEDEAVHTAVRSGGELQIATSKRLLLVEHTDRWSTNSFQSIPYSSVMAFQVNSVGFSAAESSLTVWTDVPGLPLRTQFVQGALAGLSDAILRAGTDASRRRAPPGALLQEATVPPRRIFNLHELFHPEDKEEEATECETNARLATQEFKQEKPILSPDEQVLFACRVRNVSTLLTTQRAVKVEEESRGVRHRSIPYGSVGAFSVGVADTLTKFELLVSSASGEFLETEQEYARYKVNIFDISGVLTSAIVPGP